jgi:hypothetical protein
MEHGKDHDERSLHVRAPRSNNTPPDDPESEDSGSRLSGAEGGSRPAPTRRAAEREAERHRLERERGRFAAGEGGLRNDVRAPSVTRDDLEEAAREADRTVGDKQT